MSTNFPGVSFDEPKVRQFHLFSFFDGLLEHAIVVPNSIAPGWVVPIKKGKRCNKIKTYMVARESKKQAANRPKPPFPKAASASFFKLEIFVNGSSHLFV